MTTSKNDRVGKTKKKTAAVAVVGSVRVMRMLLVNDSIAI